MKYILSASAFVIFVASTFSPTSAFAFKILKSNAQSVIIENDENSALVVGDRFFAIVEGKRKGIITITEIKNKKAKGKITKGKVPEGSELQMIRKAEEGPKDVTKESTYSKDLPKISDITFGVLGGLNYSMQTVTAANTSRSVTEDLSMTGIGYSGRAIADYPVIPSLAVIVRAGLEQFSVTGTSSKSLCKSTSGCTTSILYLAGDGLVRWNFTEGTMVWYGLAGLGLYMPASKSSNILDESKLSLITPFYLGGGLNYQLSKDSYIPMTVEYSYFPPSSDVKTSMISFRGGYAWKF